MPVDYQMLRKGTASLGDYQRLQEEFDQKKALTAAEIAKANQVDADKLGEQAFMKVAMGQALTPQEQAAAQLMDAKSGGISFNPVTGEMMQKPRISDRIGIPGMKPGGMSGGIGEMSAEDVAMIPAMDESLLNMGGGGSSYGAPAAPTAGPREMTYQKAMKEAAGNPKLQQALATEYLKNQLDATEGQSNAALYADRMKSAEQILSRPDVQKIAMDLGTKAKASIPVAGNYMVPKEYQAFDQARRNFINATLRRESGAVISDAEFENANKQYFPMPGDAPETLLQKARNRADAINGIARAAGGSYEALGGMSGMPKVQGATGGENDVQSLIDRYAQ